MAIWRNLLRVSRTYIINVSPNYDQTQITNQNAETTHTYRPHLAMLRQLSYFLSAIDGKNNSMWLGSTFCKIWRSSRFLNYATNSQLWTVYFVLNCWISELTTKPIQLFKGTSLHKIDYDVDSALCQCCTGCNKQHHTSQFSLFVVIVETFQHFVVMLFENFTIMTGGQCRPLIV